MRTLHTFAVLLIWLGMNHFLPVGTQLPITGSEIIASALICIVLCDSHCLQLTLVQHFFYILTFEIHFLANNVKMVFSSIQIKP